jgi:hypothetical protein
LFTINGDIVLLPFFIALDSGYIYHQLLISTQTKPIHLCLATTVIANLI